MRPSVRAIRKANEIRRADGRVPREGILRVHRDHGLFRHIRAGRSVRFEYRVHVPVQSAKKYKSDYVHISSELRWFSNRVVFGTGPETDPSKLIIRLFVTNIHSLVCRTGNQRFDVYAV